LRGAEEAFDGLFDYLESGLNFAELAVVVASIVTAVDKGTASKAFRQLSRSTSLITSSYITLTAGQAVIGTAVLGTVREEHDFGTNELINPEDTGL